MHIDQTPLNQPPSMTNPSPSPANLTPGWRTSEFWMTALSHLGVVLAAASGVLPSKYAAIAVATSQVAYNLSRGLAKQSQ